MRHTRMINGKGKRDSKGSEERGSLGGVPLSKALHVLVKALDDGARLDRVLGLDVLEVALKALLAPVVKKLVDQVLQGQIGIDE